VSKCRIATAQGFALLLLAGSLLPSALQAEVLDDPMRPPAVISSHQTKKEGSGYQLNSIFISPTRRSAIINGKSVSVGDRVGNARVIEIQATEVRISLAGKTRTLTLLPLSIKKPAEASQP